MPDDDDKPFDHTLPAPPGAVAPPPRRVTARPQQSPFQKTITAPPIANAETIASDSLPPATSPPTSRSGVSRSSVGSEMKAASIERFTLVDNGRFELLDELARGGLGRVFRARDPRTGRIVAIKEVLHPQPEIMARFAREALVTANLQHPAIVPVYEVGRWPTGEPFYAMKLVEGRTLEELIRESTPTERIALLPHVIDVAQALAYAHGEHVIHRDLKPANILVGAYGETVVIDWGLAKNLATGEEIELLPVASTIPPESNETIAGSILGTPAYMPPEQAIGEKLDERADVYAIGAILYHLLSGVRPFAQAKSLDELLELVAYKTPKPLAELAPDLPPELIAIVEHAMARDPAARYATARGIAQDLRAFQAGKLVGAHRYTTWQLIRRWVGQHKATVATGAIALGVLVVVAALGVWRITGERDEANRQRGIAQVERGDAQDARALAEKRFADSLQELARQALIAGDVARALPLASGAMASDEPSAALAVIAAQARAPYLALTEVIPSPSFGVSAGGVSRDAGRIYTSSGGDETVRAWDVASGKELWSKKAGYLVTASRDGANLLVASNAGDVLVLAADTGAERTRWKIAATPADLPTSLVWSPDNQHYAAASDTGRAWLGSLDALPRALDGHATKILDVQFSPDGALVASASENNSALLLHDGVTGALVQRVAVAKGGVWSLDWVDATHLLIGDAQFAIDYDVRARAVQWKLDHGTWVYGFLPGGTPEKPWLMTFGDGSTARLWNLATKTKIADLAGHNLGIEHAVTVGDWLVTGDELGNGFVWDPRTGERVMTLPRDSVIIGLGASRDRLVVFRQLRQEIWTLPPASAPVALLRRIDGHTARIRDLQFEGNDVIWTASNDGTVRRTQLADGAARVFGTAGYTETIRAVTDPDAAKPPYAHGMRSLHLSSDFRTVITANEDGGLVAWDAATAKPRVEFKGHTGRVRAVAVTGTTLYSVGDTTVRRWDTTTGAQTAVADLGRAGWDVNVFPDGTVAVIADESPAPLTLWTRDLKAKPFAFEPLYTHDLPIVGDRLLASTFTQVYQLDSSGAVKANAPQPKVFTTSVGTDRFVAGDPRGDIVLRDWSTAKTLRSWTAGDGIVVAVAFSPDNALVASISGNRVRIWDPETGALLAATPVLPSALTQLAWSADGTRLAIAGSASTVWVWDVRPRAALTDLAAFARCASQWQLADANLVQVPVDVQACRILARPR